MKINISKKLKQLKRIKSNTRYKVFQILKSEPKLKKKGKRKTWYNEVYLQSVEWQNVKSNFFKSDKFTGSCRLCSQKNSLHVHHITYKREGGKELMSDLVALCKPCHAKAHVSEKGEKLRLDGKWLKNRFKQLLKNT